MKISQTAAWLCVLAVGTGMGSSAHAGAIRCEQLRDGSVEMRELGKGNPVNRSNWKSFDVLVSFDSESCLKSLSQRKISVGSEILWLFKTTEDECDGGNVYGVIYSEDLRTPIAHIYDSEITCEPDWRDDYRAVQAQ